MLWYHVSLALCFCSSVACFVHGFSRQLDLCFCRWEWLSAFAYDSWFIRSNVLECFHSVSVMFSKGQQLGWPEVSAKDFQAGRLNCHSSSTLILTGLLLLTVHWFLCLANVVVCGFVKYRLSFCKLFLYWSVSSR